ncbi:MAG: sensor histidine kinase, partial [Cyclobacteriaceae bacterium]
ETDELYSFARLKAASEQELFAAELILKTKEISIPVGDLVLKQIQVKENKICTLFLFKEIGDRIKARELEDELEKRRITSLIEGQEHERSRLAREIHDGIGQMLNLIKIKTQSIENGAINQELLPLLNQTLEEVRNISEDLHPSRLSDFSIEKNIEKLIEQFNANPEINFSFSCNDVPELDLTRKTHIFRIVQECISNVVKHSKAHECAVQLYGMDKSVQLTIEDDGVGYSTENPVGAAGAHHGIQNIQYRVNSMDGIFTVDSSEQNGTMILINIPLSNAN